MNFDEGKLAEQLVIEWFKRTCMSMSLELEDFFNLFSRNLRLDLDFAG